MEEKNVDIYFKSEEHKIIFALLYTDTYLREDLLGIFPELYSDASKAKEWRNGLIKKIHPDNCKIKGAADAVKKINLLYARMTESGIDVHREDGDNNGA